MRARDAAFHCALLIFSSAFVASANGSDEPTTWAKSYGGTGDDVIRYVKQTKDGSYLVAGFTHSYGIKGDILVLKLNPDGSVQWQKTYGGSKFEEPSVILEMPDGYLVMEQTASFSGGTDGWILKLDSGGNILWQKTYGGGSFDEISAAVPTGDGGFVIAGETKSFGAVIEDFWIVKFDSQGNVQWEKRHGGPGLDEAESIALTPEGGFLVVGHTQSFGVSGYDVWALKLDSSGSLLGGCTPEFVSRDTKLTVKNSNALPVERNLSVANAPVKFKNTNAIVLDSTATVRVQCDIASDNVPPVAQDDIYATDQRTPLVVPSPGILINDSDGDGDAITAELVSGPNNGSLSLNPDGSFTYTPDSDFTGQDTFTYKASDGIASSNVATVTITVAQVNNPPTANDDFASTTKNTPVLISNSTLVSNDTDPDGDDLVVESVDGSSTAGGTVTYNDNGTITYMPPTDFAGEDTFNYVVTDGFLDDTGQVSVTVSAQ